jgi:hypothetical protein
MNRMLLSRVDHRDCVATRLVCAYIKAMYEWTIIMVLH